MARHINIPIFIPHLGCPNLCVFCNQRTISGVKSFDISSVQETIERNLSTARDGDECEIAFFSGSFTGIDRALMVELLEIAAGYKSEGRVSSIRCSTRPDYIDAEVLSVLKRYGVDTVELGVQSASNRVLSSSKRGHTSEVTERAARLIVESGMAFGGQMMIGLPDSTPEDEIMTARVIAALGAVEARIYPTLVFRDTELCSMTEDNGYKPLSLDEAIERSAAALEVLISNNIKILRIGLCESEGLSGGESLIAGPYHPAMGELVIGEVYYNRILRAISASDIDDGAEIELFVPLAQTSKAIGHAKRNRERLLSLRNITIKKVNEQALPDYTVRVSKCPTR